MTMIEKVARAIAVSEGHFEVEWANYEDAAKAAIEAMRHPTIDMVDAGYNVHQNHYGPGLHPCVVHYRIMIAAALEEK